MILRVVLQLAYFILLIPLALYALTIGYLIFLYVRRPPRPIPPPAVTDWPLVAVQVPLYNEPAVAERVIRAVAALDYPRTCLHIQILDDSTDDTPTLLAPLVAELRAAGFRIDHIRRASRDGYKAGALANGLRHTDAEYIAIFDADFVPPPHFLRNTVPYLLADPGLGLVQARWSHLNAETNLITRVQALILDGHFAIEQATRAANGLLMTFNGTGGVWRRACIQEAGGWQSDTLAEDADLSLRAQFLGWRCAFLSHCTVPGELPPQIASLKSQQARWACGTTGVLLKLHRRLWQAPIPRRARIMAFFGLLGYPLQSLSLALLVLQPILILSGAYEGLKALPLAPFGVIGMVIPILYVIGQGVLYPDWMRRTFALPALLLFGVGLAVANSRAVLATLQGRKGDWQPTPKFKIEGQAHQRQYVALPPPADPNLPYEVAFGLYALVGGVIAAYRAPSLMLYFAVYALGFFVTALWGGLDRWRSRIAQQELS